jgi:RNA polymerase primary sigma factor
MTRRPGPPELALYAWQADALDAWARCRCRGVIEAVTGAGKTMVGIAASLAELAERGQVLVVVPTVELQDQWRAELGARLGPNLPVGALGNDAADTLLTHDVVVAVVNSARRVDVRPIRRRGLLVADECHRYGSDVNRLALDERFDRRLGLSATYARDDDGHLAWLDPYFGGTCFLLGYDRAIADEVTAHFAVALIGVGCTPGERLRYDELTGELVGLRARLVGRHGVPPSPFEAFLRAVNLLAEAAGSDGGGVARRFLALMRERRRLLADTPAKTEALAGLAAAVSSAQGTIVFTESIDASERACRELCSHGLAAGVVHSALAATQRREVLRRFAAGKLAAISAPRVLDEGVDVPAADLAVIVGASRSRRQMVQRIGRVLRRKPDGGPARIAVLYVEGTVEDPASGAHEAFLSEITSVADEVRAFPATSSGPAAASEFLARCRSGRRQPPPLMSGPGRHSS